MTTADPAPAIGHPPHPELEELMIAELGRMLAERRMSSSELVAMYIDRIDALDRTGPALHSVICLDPTAMTVALRRDKELATGHGRGPLHGVPLLVKDMIDVRGLPTTMGSLALRGRPAVRDAAVVRRLRRHGAIILGKANLTEWADVRSPASIGGWSALGGQTRNPYVLDRSPMGSSSGSAAAVAANLCMVALGTETDGSIVKPAAACSIVGFKPTIGLVPMAGVLPIIRGQDAVGPMSRTVDDAWALFDGMVSDERPSRAASGEVALRGVRLGVPGHPLVPGDDTSAAVFEQVLDGVRTEGATLVAVDLSEADALIALKEEDEVLHREIRVGIDAHLRKRRDPAIRNLADVIAFDRAHAGTELAGFGQESFERAATMPSRRDRRLVRQRDARRRLSRDLIDGAVSRHRLTALIAPVGPPAPPIGPAPSHPPGPPTSLPSAFAGYPIITVPGGFGAERLPVGVALFAEGGSDRRLLALARAIEQTIRARRPPTFLPSAP